MANPTIVNRQDSDGSATFTKPTGLADNDVLYLMFCAFGDNLTSSNEPTAPSGFTELYSVERGQGDGTGHPNAFVACYRKKITSASGEGASYAVGAPAGGYGSSAYQGGSLYAVRGADTTTPEDDSGGFTANSATATTGATVDSSGNDWLLFVNCVNMVTLSPGAISGMTNDFNGDTGDCRVYSQSGAGSALTGATRSSAMGSADSWAIGFVVVKPTAGGSGTNATPTVAAATFVVPTPTFNRTTTPTPTKVTGVWVVQAPVVSTAVSATLTKVTGVFTIPTPTFTRTTTPTPTAVAGTFTIPTPSITVTTTPTPTAVAGVFTIPTPAVTTGSTTNISATAVAATFVVPTPAITGSASVAVTAVAGTWTAPTPSVTTGSTTNVTPTAVAATFVAQTPAITASATVAATAVAATFTAPTPTISRTTTPTPAAVAMLMAAPTPGITTTTSILATMLAAVFVVRAPTIGGAAAVFGGDARQVFTSHGASQTFQLAASASQTLEPSP